MAIRDARIRLPKSAGVRICRPVRSCAMCTATWRPNRGHEGAQLVDVDHRARAAMWLLTSFPTTVIYTMPTARDVGKFTQGRINPIVRSSQYLLDRIIDVDSVDAEAVRGGAGQLEYAAARPAFAARADDLLQRRIEREGRRSRSTPTC